MATIQTGSIVSDIRGSIGGETYARNRGGLYVKARSTPTQPASTYRDATQATFTALTQAWSGTLSEAQRETWRQYAQTWTEPNRLGQQIRNPPHNHFVRCNFYPHLTTAAMPYLVAPARGPAHLPEFTFARHDFDTYDATGTTSPDCTGNFAYTGIYNSQPYYFNAAKSFYLWHYTNYNRWTITTTLGQAFGNMWYRIATEAGTYNPSGTYTGNPTLAAGAPIIGIGITLPPTTYDPLPGEINLYLSIGKEVPPGRNYYSTPYRFTSYNLWNGSIWTEDPWNVFTPWTITAGKKLFCRMVAVLAGGETSGAYRCNKIIS